MKQESRKPKTRSKNKIVKYYKKGDSRLKLTHKVTSTPACMACQRPDNASLWNNSKLEICHIIPFAISKDNNIENLILLCSLCHFDSPDTRFLSIFQTWINHQRIWNDKEANNETIFEKSKLDYGISDCDVKKVLSGEGFTTKFRSFLEENHLVAQAQLKNYSSLFGLIHEFLK